MPSVTFTPTTPGPFAPGERITFEFRTSSDFPDFAGVFFDLTYDADLLDYAGTEFLPALELPLDQEQPEGATGEITLEKIQAGTLSTGTLPAGDELVATISFDVLAPGDASVLLEPAGDEFFGDGVGVPIDVDAPQPVQFVINVPPQAADDSVTVLEDESITVDVLANDSNPGGAAPTIDSVGSANNGMVDIVDGKIVYTPDENFNGDDSFTYTIVDEFDVTAEATVDVRVTAVNDDPFADDDEGFIDKNESVRVSVLANDSDVDGDFLSVESIAEGAGNGTVTIDGDEIVYTPVTDFVGTDSFTYTVTDGNGGSDTATVNITVNETNVDPVGGDDTATVDEDGSVSIAVLDNDTDGDDDDLSIGNFTLASNGSVTQTGDALVYTPNANFNGSDSFTYQVDDGKGGTDLATVNVTVTPVNDEPVAVDDSASVNQDGSVEIDVLDNDSDVDGDTITLAAGGLVAANGTVAVTAGGLTYTPNAGFSGLDSFSYTVEDGNGGTDIATVDIAVNGVTLTPKSTDPVKPGERVEIDLITSEGFEEFVAVSAALSYDADALQFVEVLSNPALDFVDFDAPGNPSGLTTISPITISDVAGGDSLSGQVTVATFVFEALTSGDTDVSIAGVDGFFFLNGEFVDGQPVSIFNGTAETTVVLNSAPEALDDAVTVDEDTTTNLTALLLLNDTDEDNDELQIISVGAAANGTVTLSGGIVEYTPDANYFGTDEFEYTISDGGVMASATVAVDVTPVNDAPELTLAETVFEAVEGDSAPLFTATAFDVEGEDVSFSLGGDDAGSFQIDAITGEVTFGAAPEFDYGEDNTFTFDVIASDGDLTDTQGVTVSVLKDTDGDMVADIRDNAIFARNADQRDSNGDGFGNVIDGDFNGDRNIDIFDLLIFRNAFGSTGLTDGVDPEADVDFTGDGTVDTSDLLAFRGVFGDTLTAELSAFITDDIA